MPNSYYNHGTTPATNAPGSSAAIRAEFDAITTGFALLPTLAGAGNQIVAINAGGTAMVTIAAIDNFPIGQVTPAAGKFTTLQATGATTLAAMSATSIDTSPIGQTTPAAGKFTTLVATGLTTLAAMTATGINSSPIGGTTPAAGAFTTLSATGATTLTVTSGTALTVTGVTGNNTLQLQDGTTTGVVILSAGLFFGTSSNHDVKIRTNGLDRVNFPSTGGVTIGTPTSGTALAINAVSAGAALTATDGTVSATLASFVSAVLSIGATSNHTVSLISNNLSRVAIAGAGNVTVNAPASGDTLQVKSVTAQRSISAGVFGSANNPRIDFIHTESSAFSAIDITGSSVAGGAEIRLGGNSFLTVASTRATTIPAPTSGITLTVTAVATGSALQATDGTVSGPIATFSGSTMTYGAFSNHAVNLMSNSAVRVVVAAAGNVTVNAPASGIGLTVNGFSGTHSTKIADSATNLFNAGFLEVPQNQQDANYTLVVADSGKHIYHTSGSAHTWTIPANASVAYPIGTTLTFVNDTGAANVTIAITTDTMRLSPGGTTGSRTLAANGRATALKMTSNSWQISGTGLT